MFEMSDSPSATCGSQIPYKDVVIIVLGGFRLFFHKMFIFATSIKDKIVK